MLRSRAHSYQWLPCQMILYKYFPCERIDVLESLLIRFTQPKALNDPQEAIVALESLDSSAIVAKLKAAPLVTHVYEFLKRQDYDTIWLTSYEQLGEDQLRQTLDGVIRQVLSTVIRALPPGTSVSRDVLEQCVTSSAQLERDLHRALAHKLAQKLAAERAADVIKDILGIGICEVEEVIGILCLSAVWDSLPMWSHYACDFAGICLGFDSDADFLMNSLYGMRTGPVPTEYVTDVYEVAVDEIVGRAHLRYFRKPHGATSRSIVS
jgi:hypothetical protein